MKSLSYSWRRENYNNSMTEIIIIIIKWILNQTKTHQKKREKSIFKICLMSELDQMVYHWAHKMHVYQSKQLVWARQVQNCCQIRKKPSNLKNLMNNAYNKCLSRQTRIKKT